MQWLTSGSPPADVSILLEMKRVSVVKLVPKDPSTFHLLIYFLKIKTKKNS